MLILRWTATAFIVAGIASAAPAEEIGAPAFAGPDGPWRTNAEIVVTGEKASRALRHTAAAVSVTTGEAIADQNLLSLYDILDRTPNVVVEGNRTTFSIRGIDAFSVSGGGDGPLATVYLDGAAIPRLALSSGPLDLHDVAQVEVFRGPQSTIQGRNALAGSVIVRTADPSFDWAGRARLLMSDKDGQRRASIAAGGPLIGNQVAFRLAGEMSRADGLIHNITTQADGDERRSQSLRGKLLITPRSVPDLQVIASLAHDRHRRGTFYTEFDAPWRPEDRVTTADISDRKMVASDIGTLTVRHDLDAGLTLNAASSYSRIRFRSQSDADRSPAVGQISSIDDQSITFQQEIRLNIQKNWIEGVVGVFYLRERRDYVYEAVQSQSLSRLGVDRQLAARGLSQPAISTIIGLYGGVITLRNGLQQPRLTENRAGFADFTFPLNERLRLRVGLRYDLETQKLRSVQTVAIDRPLPDPLNLPIPSLAPVIGQLNAALQGVVEGANSADPERRVSYQAWLPSLSISYDIAPDLTLSLTTHRGYRAGGSGLNQQRAETYDYAPEYVWNHELALRSEWLDRRLIVNANAYWTEWKGQQVMVQLTPGAAFDTQVVNAGRSRLHGIEIEVRGRPAKTLSLQAAAGYGDTRFRDFTAPFGLPVQSAQGNEFPRAPHWTLSGAATYVHPCGLFANVSANHRSAYYQSLSDQRMRDIPGRTLVNARVGWENRRLSASVFANNIFDVQKPDQFFTDFDGRRKGTLNDPRIVGIIFEGRI